MPKRSLSELNVALLRAASSGDVVLAESLINEGVNPNTTNIDGVTPLMIAAGTGQTAVVDLLLKKGAQPELQTRRDGVTALMFAADGGHRAVIESLLNGSAKVRTKDKGGREAIDYAAMKGDKETVKLLEDRGGILKPLDALGAFLSVGSAPDLNDLLVVAGARKGSLDGPLMLAVLDRDAERVKFLLEMGANPNAPHGTLGSPLDVAKQQGSAEIVALLEGATKK